MNVGKKLSREKYFYFYNNYVYKKKKSSTGLDFFLHTFHHFSLTFIYLIVFQGVAFFLLTYFNEFWMKSCVVLCVYLCENSEFLV